MTVPCSMPTLSGLMSKFTCKSEFQENMQDLNVISQGETIKLCSVPKKKKKKKKYAKVAFLDKTG